MKTINQINLYCVITFSLFNIPCAGMWGKSQKLGVDAAKVVSGAGVEATKIAADAAIEAAQRVGVDASKVAAEATIEAAKRFGVDATRVAADAAVEVAKKVGTDATKIAADAAVDAAQRLGADATKIAADAGIEATKIATEAGKDVAKNIVQNIAPYAGAVVGIFAIKEATTIGMDIYKYNNPDQEKLERERTAKRKIAIYDAEDAFRSCLMNSAKNKRNQTGFPINCEECGQNFAMTAGRGAFREMVDTFKETYKQ